MRKVIPAFFICLAFAAQAARPQSGRKPGPAPSPPAKDEVLTINTVLVQTDVRVYDRAGHFVDNLRREQFELKVNGRVVPISFFELVVAGGAAEAAQLRAAGSPGPAATPPDVGTPRGRAFYFFFDNLHLAAESFARVKRAARDFVDREMGESDRALIVSAADPVGASPQATGDKAQLRAALSRINYRGGAVEDTERPAMNDVQAEAIERNDLDVLEYFVEATLRESPQFNSVTRGSRAAAERYVRRRARSLAAQAAAAAERTFSALAEFVVALPPTRGQKLAFFVSDGFALYTGRADTLGRLRRVTDAAARAGVVFYTLDARGLDLGLRDAASQSAADIDGSLARSGLNEGLERQDVLHAIAADTGGRPIRNTNSLGRALSSVAEETSRYYLLAWRAEDEGRKGVVKKLEVRVIDRPDLTVRVRQGFFDAPALPFAP
jgi:VWFA-related protein